MSIVDVVEYVRNKCIDQGGRYGLYDDPIISEVETEVLEQRRWVQLVRTIYLLNTDAGLRYVAVVYEEPLTESSEGSESPPDCWDYYEVSPQKVTSIKFYKT